MKTLLKTIAVAFLASTLAFTNVAAKTIEPATSFSVGIYNVINTLNMKIFVEKEVGSYLKISLKNEKGETLFTEFAAKKSTSYSKNFNLENLEDGNYYFEITDKKTTTIKEVIIASKIVTSSRYINTK